ncbi:hypothetical protein [uncultured Nostoc sp.]|uniref:hypothetical protein n=1 Tax=uncultured Nostoc sp. TaxID=340711 RepID=UPI0035CC67BD
MVFIDPQQILPEGVHTLETSAFKDLWLPVSNENRGQITDVTPKLYRDNFDSNMRKTGNAYQKTNPAVLWFLNTTGCRRCLILACFMCKQAFKIRPDISNCCDNCVYNSVDAGQIPAFELHDVTAKMGMRYEKTLEYSELQLSVERQRLLAPNLPKNPRTMVELADACEAAFDGFAIRTWPNDYLANLKFPPAWRQHLAKATARVSTVEHMRKKLLPVCQLGFLSLSVWANELVEIIVSIAQDQALPRPPEPDNPPATPQTVLLVALVAPVTIENTPPIQPVALVAPQTALLVASVASQNAPLVAPVASQSVLPVKPVAPATLQNAPLVAPVAPVALQSASPVKLVALVAPQKALLVAPAAPTAPQNAPLIAPVAPQSATPVKPMALVAPEGLLITATNHFPDNSLLHLSLDSLDFDTNRSNNKSLCNQCLLICSLG